MDSEMMALARRAVACKAWRWMPGCPIAVFEDREDVEQGYAALAVEHPADGRAMHALVSPCDGLMVRRIAGHDLPDLSNPATLGCLLALVREAWAMPATACNDSTTNAAPARWWVRLGDDVQTIIGAGPTEAHALVAALEAAP